MISEQAKRLKTLLKSAGIVTHVRTSFRLRSDRDGEGRRYRFKEYGHAYAVFTPGYSGVPMITAEIAKKITAEAPDFGPVTEKGEVWIARS